MKKKFSKLKHNVSQNLNCANTGRYFSSSDMQRLRSDGVHFQQFHSTTGGSSKGVLKQEMAKAFNITTVAPKSIVSEIVRCLRKLSFAFSILFIYNKKNSKQKFY